MNYGTDRDPKWIDNVIVRQKARKRWRCWGNGARSAQHAEGCPVWIEPGAGLFIEYVGETSSYQTGTHHCWPCALAFFTRPAAPTPSRSSVTVE